MSFEDPLGLPSEAEIEAKQLRDDLARVTAELEHHKSVKETIDSAHKELSREHAALRARSAELEAQIERDAWTLSPEMVQTRNDQLAAKLEQAEQRNSELESSVRDLRVAYEQNASQCVRLNRELALKSDTVEWLNGVTIQRQRAEQAERRNAELVAALDDLLGCPTVTDLATCPNGDPSRIDEAPEWQAVLQISCAWTRYKKLKVLARAESATPAKHPDTVRLDWLLANGDPLVAWINTDSIVVESRDAIDAARKGGAE